MTLFQGFHCNDDPEKHLTAQNTTRHQASILSAKDDPPNDRDDWTGPTEWEKAFIALYYPSEGDLRASGVTHFTRYAWEKLKQLRWARDCGCTDA